MRYDVERRTRDGWEQVGEPIRCSQRFGAGLAVLCRARVPGIYRVLDDSNLVLGYYRMPNVGCPESIPEVFD